MRWFPNNSINSTTSSTDMNGMETEADDNERSKLAREFSLLESAAKLSAMASTIQLASLHAIVLIGTNESRSPHSGYSYYTLVVCAFSLGGLLSIPVDHYLLPMITNVQVVHVLVMGVFTLAGEALFIESVRSTSSLKSSTDFILKIIGSRLLMGIKHYYITHLSLLTTTIVISCHS
jgi:hypothetical protein